MLTKLAGLSGNESPNWNGINKQKEIGNKIFYTLINAQREAANYLTWYIRPSSVDPFRIEICTANWAGPVNLSYLIKIDLSLPKDKQIKIWGARGKKLEFEDSVEKGERYINKSLIPRIFLKS